MAQIFTRQQQLEILSMAEHFAKQLQRDCGEKQESIDLLQETLKLLKLEIHDLYSERVLRYGKAVPGNFHALKMFESKWVDKEKVDDDIDEYCDTDLADEDPLPIERPNRLIIEENRDFIKHEADYASTDHQAWYELWPNPRLDSKFKLNPYQMVGCAWLQHLYLGGKGGCLLADEMGLGKTLQLLYFIDWHAQWNPNHGPYLIIAPVSILDNWKNEYNKFFCEPRLRVKILRASDVLYGFSKRRIDEMQNLDIIITSYETLRKSQLNLCAVRFEIVVLDEAQRIKNPSVQTTLAAKALNAKFKVAVTGTPVENTVTDLWSIMDFCVPGLLGSAADFSKKFSRGDSTAALNALGHQTNDQMGKHFLRRLKTDVLKDLPSITKQEILEIMPPLQSNEYDDIIRAYRPGVNILSTIHGLKTVSEHPFLHNDTLLSHSADEIISSSARLISTMRILDDIKSKDEKVIVFAERKDMQKALQKIFYEKFDLAVMVINGDTPTCDKYGNARQEIIDVFQASEGFNILIMSPLSAGVGLNVTAANHVIHYSRHWNPAKESQATDRTHRIGQEKDVQVYYPMAINPDEISFDEVLADLLRRKQSLADSTAFPTRNLEVTVDEVAQAIFGEKKEDELPA